MTLPTKRAFAILPWALMLASLSFTGWSLRERATTRERADSLTTLMAGLRFELDEAEIARYQLEREREANDRNLKNLFDGREDLRRSYEKEKAASNEAIAQKVDALRQSKAKEAALEGERTARGEEQEQRRLADARADSIAAQQRLTDRANQRLQASKVAQNSMAIKGDQRLRGLMAVEAFRSMDGSGGDVNKEEIVRALQGALEELERTAPVGAQRLGAGPRAMRMEGGELVALGNDGLLLGIDASSWSKRTIADLSQRTGKTGGRAFLGSASVSSGKCIVLTADLERRIMVSSAADGALIAAESRTPHTEDIVAMAAFPDGSGLVSGDRDGRAVVWAVDGAGLRVVKEFTIGGVVRALVAEPLSGTVIAVNGTEKVSIVSKDGTLTTVSLSDADRANCLAIGGRGEVLIGTHQGDLFVLGPADKDLRRIHTGSGQRVETIAAGGPDGRFIACVDGVKRLTVVDRESSAASAFQMAIAGIPNTMAFGSADVLYLAFNDLTVRRVFINSRSMAERICALAGRSWTTEEWNKHIGEGTPSATCPPKE